MYKRISNLWNSFINSKLPYWILSGVFIVGGICCFIFKSFFDAFQTEFSLFGSLASTIGVFIAVVQVAQTKKVADSANTNAISANEHAKKAEIHSKATEVLVRESLDTFNRHLTTIDISAASQLPNEIQTFIQAQQYQLAYNKIRDLKNVLIDMQKNPVFKDTSVQDCLVEYTQQMTLSLNSFDTAIRNNSKPNKINKIGVVIENIRTMLVEISKDSKYNSIR